MQLSNSEQNVQGGEGTREEMCFGFTLFYPAPADGNVLGACLSYPNEGSFTDFYYTLQR